MRTTDRGDTTYAYMASLTGAEQVRRETHTQSESAKGVKSLDAGPHGSPGEMDRTRRC